MLPWAHENLHLIERFTRLDASTLERAPQLWPSRGVKTLDDHFDGTARNAETLQASAIDFALYEA